VYLTLAPLEQQSYPNFSEKQLSAEAFKAKAATAVKARENFIFFYL